MSQLVATPAGIKGYDLHGTLFGVLAIDVDYVQPRSTGCRVYLKDGYMLRLRESYDEVSAALASCRKK